MYAYLQSHGIKTLADLQQAVSMEKDKRRYAIHTQNAISKKQKDMESLITAGENYKPLRKYHKTLDALEGAKRQEFKDKYADQLDLADTWLASIKYYTGKTLFQPSKWEKDAKQLVTDMKAAKKDLQDADTNIEMLSDILDMVQAVDTSRQVARRKEMQKNTPEASQPQRKAKEDDTPKKRRPSL